MKRDGGCNNPSKWDLQQQIKAMQIRELCCNNPSKWGLQQPIRAAAWFTAVVITPQSGVFNNAYYQLVRVQHCLKDMFKRIICVRARKCSDTILDSGSRYYRLSQPCCINDKLWHFFVLLRENSAGPSTSIFRVIMIFNF